MNFLIPFISSILFRLGGSVNKWIRWILIGYFIGAVYQTAWPMVAYFLATSAIPYGDKSWLNRFVTRGTKWFICGFAYGLASAPILHWLSVAQAIIGGGVFLILMSLSNDGIPLMINDGDHARFRDWKLDQKWVELGIGFLGTIMYVFK